MKKLFTKTSMARELNIDHRNPVLNEVKPIGEIVIGEKTYPVYDRAGIDALKEQRALEKMIEGVLREPKFVA